MATLRLSKSYPRLAYEIAGDGPPVIFLHGIGGSRQNWRAQLDAFESDFTVVAWDARGYGDSDDDDGPRKFSDFGDDLALLLDELDVATAHLVGLSMGARILMNFYPRHSDRVATMTLCDCFYSFASALTREKQAEYVELRERPLREGKTFVDLAPTLIDSLVGPNCSDHARSELRDSIHELRVEPYLKTLRASVTFDETATIGSIAVPVQLIFGQHDRLTPPELGTDMAQRIPGAELAVIANAGHLANLEQPVEFNRVLGDFLTKHAATARYTSQS